MNTKRAAAAALLATSTVAWAAAPASAQPCYYPYYGSYYDVPLFWPFYAAAAIVGTAAAIAATPFTVLTGQPYWPGWYGCTAPNSPYIGYPPPPPYPTPYAGYGYYGPPR